MPNGKISSKLISAGTGFLLGSSLLISCSILQKVLAGFDPFVIKAYIVPFWFGGIAGSLLASKCAKVNDLNAVLLGRLNEMEEYLPICSHCKRIRETEKDSDGRDSWKSIEEYITEKTSSRFSHSLCPECLEEQYPEFSTGKYSKFN